MPPPYSQSDILVPLLPYQLILHDKESPSNDGSLLMNMKFFNDNIFRYLIYHSYLCTKLWIVPFPSTRVSCPGFLNIFRCNSDLWYHLYFHGFPSFGRLSNCKWSLGVPALVRCGYGEKICLLYGVLRDGRRLQFENSPYFNKDVIYLGRIEFEGAIIYHPVQSCITMYIF